VIAGQPAIRKRGKGDGDYYLLFTSSPPLLFTVSSDEGLTR